MLREHRDLAEVADEELAALDGWRVAAERLGDRGVEHAFLHAGAQVAEDDLREVRGLARSVQRANRSRRISRLRPDVAGGGEVVERVGEVVRA